MESERRERSAFSVVLASALAFVALATGTLATWWASALLLSRGATPLLAGFAALAIVFLVPAALVVWKQERIRIPWGQLVRVGSVWSLCLVAFLATAVRDPLATALRSYGWVFAARSFGEDHHGTRLSSMFSRVVAEGLTADEVTSPVEFPAKPSALTVDVTLSGPSGTVSQQYLWDTGATYTTVTGKTAQALGITVPANAPQVTLHTATGSRTSTLVVLPRLEIGGTTLEGVTASICDTCAHDDIGGLVGLNAMQHFVAEVDGPEGTLSLTAAPDRDRTRDVAPFVALEVSGTPSLVEDLGRGKSATGGYVHWRVRVTNNSPRVLRTLTPVVTFKGGQSVVGAEIAALAPGESAYSRVVGRAGKQATGAFSLGLHRATW